MKIITRLQNSAWKVLLFVLPVCLIGFSAAQEYKVHPSTQTPSHLVTLDTLKQWEDDLSNWGRWGPDDQRGTLNLITPEKTLQAAALVQVGETVTLQHFVIEEKAMDSQAYGIYDHWMTDLDPVTGAPLRVKDGAEPSFAMDEVQFALHDGMMSHMDALCHYRSEVDGRYIIFNGYPQNLTSSGCEDLAIDKMGTSYVTRGILVDMPLLRGVDWLEPSTPIYVEDLEAWEEFAGVKIGSGDALFIRGGRWEFMTSIQINPIKGGTASPFNAHATF